MGAEDRRKLLEMLLGPADEEVSCDRCFELLDAFVDADLAGVDAAARFPGMAAHLRGCPACREDHASLRALAATAAPE